MKKTLYPLLFLAFIFSTIGAKGQSTQLVYKTKGKTAYRVNIALSDDMGHENISPEAFQNNDNVYFVITSTSSSKKDYFKDNDITDYFSKITIHQDGERVQQSKAPSSFSDEKGKMNRVIISFSKDNVKLYEPFSFVNDLGESPKIKIKEAFLPSYERYNKLFEEGKTLLSGKQYTDAFKTLSQIGNDAQSNPAISSFSFYKNAMEDLSMQAVRGYADSISAVFSQKEKQFTTAKTKPALDACEAVLNAFNSQASLFQAYLNSAVTGVDKLKVYFNKIDHDMNSSYQNDRQVFKKANMALLESSNYTEYKFYLFVDVLSRMLCQTDSLQIIQGLKPIDIKTLNNLGQKKEELSNTGWLNEFKTLISFLNDNITQKKMIFDGSILSNLKRQDTLEHQPYYEIFSAFNSLDDNPGKFYTALNNALVKCTDSTLLNDIDTWLVSYKMTHEGIESGNVSGINKGIIAIREGQWNDADNIFNILKRQANQNPVPWFYSAVIQYHNNQVFSAQAQFARALELYPHYLAPRQFIFHILNSQKQYSNLLTQADTAIYSFNIWYFHYMKALALLELNRTTDAINEVLSQCIPMNKWDEKQYYLLGDAYIQVNNFNKAREVYMHTREIDPFSGSKFFNDKMKMLIKKEQDYHAKIKQEQLKKEQEQQEQMKQEQMKKAQPADTQKVQTPQDTTNQK
jgi:tetratricopeptide (TPR) repeat protein